MMMLSSLRARPCVRSGVQRRCATIACVARPQQRVAAPSSSSFAQQQEQQSLPAWALGPASVLAPLLLTAGEAIAKDGEYGLLEGRTAALIHPAVMFTLLGATLYAGYLGYQIKRTREVGEEIKLLKKQVAPAAADGTPTPSPVDATIAEKEKVGRRRRQLPPGRTGAWGDHHGVGWMAWLCVAAPASGWHARADGLAWRPRVWAWGMAVHVLCCPASIHMGRLQCWPRVAVGGGGKAPPPHVRQSQPGGGHQSSGPQGHQGRLQQRGEESPAVTASCQVLGSRSQWWWCAERRRTWGPACRLTWTPGRGLRGGRGGGRRGWGLEHMAQAWACVGHPCSTCIPTCPACLPVQPASSPPTPRTSLCCVELSQPTPCRPIPFRTIPCRAVPCYAGAQGAHRGRLP